MPYPMKKGTLEERWIESIEDNVGLSADIIRATPPDHLSFYLQNRNNVKISRDENSNIFYTLLGDLVAEYYCYKEGRAGFKSLLDIPLGRVTINEDEMDTYLDRIDFRGPKIGVGPTRYVSSNEINRILDEIF